MSQKRWIVETAYSPWLSTTADLKWTAVSEPEANIEHAKSTAASEHTALPHRFIRIRRTDRVTGTILFYPRHNEDFV